MSCATAIIRCIGPHFCQSRFHMFVLFSLIFFSLHNISHLQHNIYIYYIILLSVRLISNKVHILLKIPNVNLQGIYVEELILETFKEKKEVESLCYPNKYQTCINFFQVLWKMIKLLGGCWDWSFRRKLLLAAIA